MKNVGERGKFYLNNLSIVTNKKLTIILQLSCFGIIDNNLQLEKYGTEICDNETLKFCII